MLRSWNPVQCPMGEQWEFPSPSPATSEEVFLASLHSFLWKWGIEIFSGMAFGVPSSALAAVARSPSLARLCFPAFPTPS